MGNFTYDVRNCFVPSNGYSFCSIDYSGLELCSVAHQLYTFYGHSTMQELLNSGQEPTDMHSKFAAHLKAGSEKKPCSYEEFKANKKLPGYKEFRQLAKPINLGFPGGIGYDKMSGILFKEGIRLPFKIIHESRYEEEIDQLVSYFRKTDTPYVRKKRLEFKKWALVYDDLVRIKALMFDLYPELKDFLREGHEQFLTGEIVKVWDKDWDEWVEEPMYGFNAHGFKRNYCVYTALCNGYLMQTPAAIGAKRAMYKIIKKYFGSKIYIPLAFIHDEALGLVLECDQKYDIMRDVAFILCSEMQKVLSSVRIAVEIEECGECWRKSGGRWSQQCWIDPGCDNLKVL